MHTVCIGPPLAASVSENSCGEKISREGGRAVLSRLPKTFLTWGEGLQGSPSAHPRGCSRMCVRPKLLAIRAGTAVAMQHFFRGFPL